MKTVLHLVHPYSSQPEVHLAPTAYCPDKYYYLMPEPGNFLEHGRMVSQAERDMNEWIRRYDNVLKGLQYWRERALASKGERVE